HAVEHLCQRQSEESDSGVQIDRHALGPDPRSMRAHEAKHRRQQVTIHLKERAGREPIGKFIDMNHQLALIADEPAVDLPGLAGARVSRSLHYDYLAVRRERNDAMRLHSVEADGLAVPMQPAAQSIVQG